MHKNALHLQPLPGLYSTSQKERSEQQMIILMKATRKWITMLILVGVSNCSRNPSFIQHHTAILRYLRDSAQHARPRKNSQEHAERAIPHNDRTTIHDHTTILNIFFLYHHNTTTQKWFHITSYTPHNHTTYNYHTIHHTPYFYTSSSLSPSFSLHHIVTKCSAYWTACNKMWIQFVCLSVGSQGYKRHLVQFGRLLIARYLCASGWYCKFSISLPPLLYAFSPPLPSSPALQCGFVCLPASQWDHRGTNNSCDGAYPNFIHPITRGRHWWAWFWMRKTIFLNWQKIQIDSTI